MPIESNRVSIECKSCRDKDKDAEEGAFKLFYTSKKTYFCRNCVSDIKIEQDGTQVIIERVEETKSESVTEDLAKVEDVKPESFQIEQEKIEEDPIANNIKIESEPNLAA